MRSKIIINSQRCKGCGLCVKACLQGRIVMASQANESGYFPAETRPDGCSGCAMCAIVCPDAAIEVCRDEGKIAAVEGKVKTRADLVRERA